MSNIKTEKDGIKWLSKKIQEDGWESIPNSDGHKTYRGRGFDLLLKKGNEIRYVEVKTTKKEKFNQRWLESLEMRAMNEHKNKFYVYLIAKKGRLYDLKIVDYKKLKELQGKEVIKVYFNFNKLY